jgi:hypothetical protein
MDGDEEDDDEDEDDEDEEEEDMVKATTARIGSKVNAYM